MVGPLHRSGELADPVPGDVVGDVVGVAAHPVDEARAAAVLPAQPQEVQPRSGGDAAVVHRLAVDDTRPRRCSRGRGGTRSPRSPRRRRRGPARAARRRSTGPAPAREQARRERRPRSRRRGRRPRHGTGGRCPRRSPAWRAGRRRSGPSGRRPSSRRPCATTPSATSRRTSRSRVPPASTALGERRAPAASESAVRCSMPSRSIHQ